MSNSLQPHGLACQAPLSLELSRQESVVGSHSLLQGIFHTQGCNPGLLHCMQLPYHLSHEGSPDTKVSILPNSKYLLRVREANFYFYVCLI